MLELLRIKNYALIDQLEARFCPGLNVLTGETGAGKSIIIGALNLVLGARASSEMLREGSDQVRVEAVFRVTDPPPRLARLLDEHDIELDCGELILSRTINADGRSRARVSGNVVPVSVLARIGDELVDLHGQHEHQSLLKTDRQLELLDAYAEAEGIRADVAQAVRKLNQIRGEIEELQADDRERARHVDFLRFELSEIDGARLEPGEEERLKTRHNLVTNAERIYTLANEIRAALYEDDQGAAINAVDSALIRLEELGAIDNRFKPFAETLEAVRVQVEDVADSLREQTDEFEFEPEELEQLNARLALIGQLKRKYGPDIESILEYRRRAGAEIEAFESRDERIARLEEEHARLLKKTETKASALSKKRKQAAKKLDGRITEALHELGMKEGRFATEFNQTGLSPRGLEMVRFMLTANAGEKTKPLKQVASGGEIARIMLAIKTVFADNDKIPALVFDEIDAGVGGQTAVKVAAKLKQLAQSHQVICITHIAQIAAAAHAHYSVSKSTHNKRTVTQIHQIDETDRVEEVARLLDGSVSGLSVDHARDLLEKKN